jgi:enamine deaminase RidA (YjgF/YER057c/UK114 family)
MNEYDFDLELDDGFEMQFRTLAVNKLMAYDALLEFLEECGVNPEEVTVINIYVDNVEDFEDVSE